MRGCLRRNRPDHLARGILEPRVARMSQAKRAGPPLARHLRAQSLEDVSGETGRTTSRAASLSPEFRGCLRRNGPDHLPRGLSEPSFSRTSQAKRPGPPPKKLKTLLCLASAGISFYHNSTPFSKLFGEKRHATTTNYSQSAVSPNRVFKPTVVSKVECVPVQCGLA